jgi:hypothetical protein
VPLGWGKEMLLNTLYTIDPSLKTRKVQLSLFPACSGPTQTALLNLDNITEYFQHVKSNAFKYELMADGSYLAIDTHFYDLSPLNTPEGEIFAELV